MYSHAAVLLPISGEQVQCRLAGAGQSMSRIFANPMPHELSVGAASERTGLAVAAGMAVRYADRNSMHGGPPQQCPGKKMYMAVNHIVLALAQDLLESAGQSGRRKSRAQVYLRSEALHFGSIQTRLVSKKAKIKLELLGIDVSKKI